MLKTLRGKDLRAFLFCAGIAILLWLFNALGKERTENIDYPIEFEYDQKNYIALKPLPTYISFSVTGNGWQILRKYLGLSLDPVRYEIERPVNRNRPYILGNQLRRNIIKVLQGARLGEVITDTVAIEMDYLRERTIDFQVDSLKVPLAEGYRIVSPITVTPRFAVSRGPESQIKELPIPYFIKLNRGNINQSFSELIDIELNPERFGLVKLDVQSTRVSFEVARYITRTKKMIIDKENFSQDSKFYLARNQRQVKVSFSFPESKGGQIRLTDFKIVADFETFNPKDSTVALEVRRKPSAVESKDIKLPKRVKLSIRDKD